MKERDAGSGEVYFDYVCRYCDSTVINIARRIQANTRSARPGNVYNGRIAIAADVVEIDLYFPRPSLS